MDSFPQDQAEMIKMNQDTVFKITYWNNNFNNTTTTNNNREEEEEWELF